MADAWQSYIDVLTKTLNQQKERDISTMDSKLAARGIAGGGAYGAGVNDISGKYADTLANTLAQIQLEKAKIDQNQKFEMDKLDKQAELDRQKVYGYPGSKENLAWGNNQPFWANGSGLTDYAGLAKRNKYVSPFASKGTGVADLYSSAIGV